METSPRGWLELSHEMCLFLAHKYHNVNLDLDIFHKSTKLSYPSLPLLTEQELDDQDHWALGSFEGGLQVVGNEVVVAIADYNRINLS